MATSKVIGIPASAKIIGIGRVTTARHRDGNTFPIELSIGEAWIGEEAHLHRIHPRHHASRQTELTLQDLQSELAHVGRLSEMGTLASSLAHELNQPLTAIANYSERPRPAGVPAAAKLSRLTR